MKRAIALALVGLLLGVSVAWAQTIIPGTGPATWSYYLDGWMAPVLYDTQKVGMGGATEGAMTIRFYPDGSAYFASDVSFPNLADYALTAHSHLDYLLSTTHQAHVAGTDHPAYALTSDLSAYLPLAGGTMAGDLNMGTNNLTNVGQIQTDDIIVYGPLATSAGQVALYEASDNGTGRVLVRAPVSMTDTIRAATFQDGSGTVAYLADITTDIGTHTSDGDAHLNNLGCTDGQYTINVGGTSWGCTDPVSAGVETQTADTIVVTVGNPNGQVSDTFVAHDGNSFILSETATTPAMTMEAQWGSVSAFNQVVVRHQYAAGGPHGIEVSIYNWTLTQWDLLATIPAAGVWEEVSYGIIDDTNYISTADSVLVQWNHPAAGVTSHYFQLDYVVLADQIGATQDHGTLAGLADDDHPLYMDSTETAAQVTAHAGSPSAHFDHDTLATDADLSAHAGSPSAHIDHSSFITSTADWSTNPAIQNVDMAGYAFTGGASILSGYLQMPAYVTTGYIGAIRFNGGATPHIGANSTNEIKLSFSSGDWSLKNYGPEGPDGTAFYTGNFSNYIGFPGNTLSIEFWLPNSGQAIELQDGGADAAVLANPSPGFTDIGTISVPFGYGYFTTLSGNIVSDNVDGVDVSAHYTSSQAHWADTTIHGGSGSGNAESWAQYPAIQDVDMASYGLSDVGPIISTLNNGMQVAHEGTPSSAYQAYGVKHSYTTTRTGFVGVAEGGSASQTGPVMYLGETPTSDHVSQDDYVYTRLYQNGATKVFDTYGEDVTGNSWGTIYLGVNTSNPQVYFDAGTATNYIYMETTVANDDWKWEGHMTPVTNNAWDLGSGTRGWRNLYLTGTADGVDLAAHYSSSQAHWADTGNPHQTPGGTDPIGGDNIEVVGATINFAVSSTIDLNSQNIVNPNNIGTATTLGGNAYFDRYYVPSGGFLDATGSATRLEGGRSNNYFELANTGAGVDNTRWQAGTYYWSILDLGGGWQVNPGIQPWTSGSNGFLGSSSRHFLNAYLDNIYVNDLYSTGTVIDLNDDLDPKTTGTYSLGQSLYTYLEGWFDTGYFTNIDGQSTDIGVLSNLLFAPANYLVWDTQTNNPAIRLNTTSYELEYRDENEATWTPLDDLAAGGAGDDLGNHTAEQTLNMATYDIDNVGDIWIDPVAGNKGIYWFQAGNDPGIISTNDGGTQRIMWRDEGGTFAELRDWAATPALQAINAGGFALTNVVRMRSPYNSGADYFVWNEFTESEILTFGDRDFNIEAQNSATNYARLEVNASSSGNSYLNFVVNDNGTIRGMRVGSNADEVQLANFNLDLQGNSIVAGGSVTASTVNAGTLDDTDDDISLDAHVTPATTGTYDLGSPTNELRNVYLQTIRSVGSEVEVHDHLLPGASSYNLGATASLDRWNNGYITNLHTNTMYDITGGGQVYIFDADFTPWGNGTFSSGQSARYWSTTYSVDIKTDTIVAGTGNSVTITADVINLQANTITGIDTTEANTGTAYFGTWESPLGASGGLEWADSISLVPTSQTTVNLGSFTRAYDNVYFNKAIANYIDPRQGTSLYLNFAQVYSFPGNGDLGSAVQEWANLHAQTTQTDTIYSDTNAAVTASDHVSFASSAYWMEWYGDGTNDPKIGVSGGQVSVRHEGDTAWTPLGAAPASYAGLYNAYSATDITINTTANTWATVAPYYSGTTEVIGGTYMTAQATTGYLLVGADGPGMYEIHVRYDVTSSSNNTAIDVGVHHMYGATSELIPWLHDYNPDLDNGATMDGNLSGMHYVDEAEWLALRIRTDNSSAPYLNVVRFWANREE